MYIRVLTCFVLFQFIFSSCETDTAQSDIERVVIRLQQEPNRLNPILQLSSYETDLAEYVFVSLGDYDPATLELVPVLLKELPSQVLLEDGPFAGGVRYDMEIVPDAVWDNGEPITGHDIAFTLKTVNHPGVDCRAWKALMDDVVAVDVVEDNPKRFSVTTSGNYFLNLEAILSAEIYPAYFYDGEGVLSGFTLTQLKDAATADSLQSNDANFVAFAEKFSSVEYSKETVQGAGPYALSSWEAGQYIILERKADYWGSAYPERTFLQSNPQQIVFQILEDNATAVTQLKNGQIDVLSLSGAPYQVYDDLKGDPEFMEQFNFFTPDVFRFYYLPLNNQDARLSDREVRKALGHLTDVDRMIQQIEGGYAVRINSIIHPSKLNYNKDLENTEYNVAKAIEILDGAGWVDTDNNGIRDKTVNGRKEELSLRFFITGSNLSQSISSMLQEEAAKAGIRLEIINKEWRKTRSENMQTGDYELTTLSVRQSPAQSDPFIYWHSNSIGLGGLNYTRYANSRADDLMVLIRTTLDNDERRNAYMELQEVFYDDHPVLFLYAPVERYVVSSKFDPLISSKKPGYFANAFKLKT